jgi:hypothetical protein
MHSTTESFLQIENLTKSHNCGSQKIKELVVIYKHGFPNFKQNQ